MTDTPSDGDGSTGAKGSTGADAPAGAGGSTAPDTPMGANEPDAPTTDRPGSALDSDRYAHLSLDDGAVVIYDRREPETWLQSDYHVEVGV